MKWTRRLLLALAVVGALAALGVAPADASAPAAATSQSQVASHVAQIGKAATQGDAATAAVSRCPVFKHWEDWVGGARVHAYVDFHPSDLCNGRHVKRAYVHLIRQCGPAFDPGRWYTSTATSTSDTRLYSVEGWIFDSVVWSCNTNAYYGVEYF